MVLPLIKDLCTVVREDNLKYNNVTKQQLSKGESILREKSIGEQEGRLHAISLFMYNSQ